MSSGRLILPLAEPALLATGEPDTGAVLSVFIAGGSTPASLYADAGLTTPITNPQVSDSAGRFYGQSSLIWADSSQAYDVTMVESDGETFSWADVYLLGEATNVSGFAPIFSPIFQGNPQAPTPSLSDNSNSIATTQYVMGQGYAPTNSPAFTGVPTAPTAAPGTDTTQLATTEFVETALGLTLPTGTASGYLVIAGIYIQWTPYSLGSAGGSTQTIAWPIKFPTACLGTPFLGNNGAEYNIAVSNPTQTGCQLRKSDNDPFAETGTVWAIGF